MCGQGPVRSSPGARVPGREAFSLIEVLVVVAVLGLLLAIAAPGFVALGPSRKAGINELAGFLEHARSEAVTRRREMVVALADERFPDPELALRAYALFTSDEDEESALRQITPWRSLPAGVVFANREHLVVNPGDAIRTLLDLPPNRIVPVQGAGGNAAEMRSLPCLVFGPDGNVREPGFADADALHLGVIEGFFDAATGRVVVIAKANGDGPAIADGLAIGFYTGRARLFTD